MLSPVKKWTGLQIDQMLRVQRVKLEGPARIKFIITRKRQKGKEKRTETVLTSINAPFSDYYVDANLLIEARDRMKISL